MIWWSHPASLYENMFLSSQISIRSNKPQSGLTMSEQREEVMSSSCLSETKLTWPIKGKRSWEMVGNISSGESFHRMNSVCIRVTSNWEIPGCYLCSFCLDPLFLPSFHRFSFCYSSLGISPWHHTRFAICIIIIIIIIIYKFIYLLYFLFIQVPFFWLVFSVVVCLPVPFF